jgi:hypothetical protein
MFYIDNIFYNKNIIIKNKQKKGYELILNY